jgi:putrescine importer
MTPKSVTNAASDVQASSAVPHLRRVLSLWDLIFYGIILIQPIAPVPLFGVAQDLSGGYFVVTILIAMFAMMITAFSYGRMASIYPTAGSAYTYVGRGLNSHLGFLAGWAMFLDYLLQPLINTIWVATALHSRYIHQMPYIVGAALIAGLMTALNLAGIRATAKANRLMLVVMCVVIAAFIVLASRYLFHFEGWGGIFSIEPFYDPKTFNSHKIWRATSFAALTYIGFDGVTTLAEDVKNPKRNVLLATVSVCIFTGVFGGLEVYLGQRVWPDYHMFPNLETAFLDVCHRVGGSSLFHSMAAILILAAFGSALTGGLGAARLLFGMGRDNVLPRRIFGHLGPSGTPTYNILIIGALAFMGAIALGFYGNAYQHAGELLNFGAFLSFMGVNFATFWQFTVIGRADHKRRLLVDAIIPLIGFLFCGLIWWNLNILAKVVGGLWFAVGLTYLAITTRGFRRAPVMIDFREA